MGSKEIVENYLKKRWYLLRCLEEGLINRSELARKISSAENIGFQSALMALRRIKVRDETKKDVDKVLRRSRLIVRTGIGIAIGERALKKVTRVMEEAHEKKEEFHLLKESNLWVAIAPMNYIRRLEKFAFKIHRDVVELVIRSPPEIEETPGVISEVLGVLRGLKINIIEFLSCWRDTILVIDKKDMNLAIEVINEIISGKIS